jgi:photosystem II stability/assembly factor-like uncharacterized protein
VDLFNERLDMTRTITNLLAQPITMALMVLFIASTSSPAVGIEKELFSQLEYRYIGPVGNRVSAVAGIPDNPRIYFAGGASGGVWKTTDGGVHWKPVFDDQLVQSIGSIAVAPSDANVVWVGTGEAHFRSNISLGNGIYKSTDGGETFRHMGLEKTGRIGRIRIDPRNADVVFAAAMGHCYGPQPERGIFRTKDGGRTWEKVLFVDENTGGAELAMDPNNPRILFASTWQLEVRTWGRESGGPGSGLYRSKDGGDTWERLEGDGLPPSPLGKIAVAVAPSNSNRVYALIETGDGVPWKGQETSTGTFWTSRDGGSSWKLTSHDHALNQRPQYYSRFVVAPDDDNEIYFCSVRHLVSRDGGVTTERMPRTGRGDDHHDMWIDPTDGDRMIVASDHHVNISINRGKSWMGIALPIAQMYHVAVDNEIPYFVYGTRQDGPSVRGPSNSLSVAWSLGDIVPAMWQSVGGFEAGYVVPDPVDNNIIWAGMKGGGLDRFDRRTNHARPVRVWSDDRAGWPAADVKYRFQWTAPIAISPHDHNKVYIGSQYVHQTTDGGHSWTTISPDLSTNDKSKQQISGGLTPDNDTPEYACVVFAIAESPLEEGVIWAGTNDGLVQITRDGGAHWTNVTANIPDLPPWGTVSNIEPSRFDAETAYITVDFHQVNNRDPYVYKTEDYGESWKLLGTGIPRSTHSYAHVVREDPVRQGMLYLGTENALYVSFDDGENWMPLQNNLPHAPMHDLVIQDHFNDLVVGTYGRGYWILDDITPLQQFTPDVLETDAHLFTPRPAYRFQRLETTMDIPDHGHAGHNPPYGASINYYLKSVPDGEVRIEILDDLGETIKTLSGTKRVGVNRVWWNLRNEPSQRTKLRTSPLYAPHVKLGPEGWRPSRGRPVSYRVAPGTYTVELAVGEKELSQKLIVNKDPKSAGTEADIQAQVEMLRELWSISDAVASRINQIEMVRKQIYDLNERLEGGDTTLISAGEELDKKLIEVEGNLIQLKHIAGQDFLRWPGRFYSKVGRLAGEVGSTDFPPTAQQIEVHEMYKAQWADYQTQIGKVLENDLRAFNELIKGREIPHIMVKAPHDRQIQ